MPTEENDPPTQRAIRHRDDPGVHDFEKMCDRKYAPRLEANPPDPAKYMLAVLYIRTINELKSMTGNIFENSVDRVFEIIPTPKYYQCEGGFYKITDPEKTCEKWSYNHRDQWWLWDDYKTKGHDDWAAYRGFCSNRHFADYINVGDFFDKDIEDGGLGKGNTKHHLFVHKDYCAPVPLMKIARIKGGTENSYNYTKGGKKKIYREICTVQTQIITIQTFTHLSARMRP